MSNFSAQIDNNSKNKRGNVTIKRKKKEKKKDKSKNNPIEERPRNYYKTNKKVERNLRKGRVGKYLIYIIRKRRIEKLL